MKRAWPFALVLLATTHSGCQCGDDTRDPLPAVGRELSAELASELPTTPDGLPMLGSVPIGDGELALVYDKHLDTPVTRWGQCMSRVHACYRANPGPIAGCIDRIEVCGDAQGGEGCCPRACIGAFRAELSEGGDEDEAVNASFLRGACIPGFLEPDGGAP